MPFFVETMVPEWTSIRVCLVVTLAVDAFEGMGTIFTLFGFKTREISLEVSFAVPSKVIMMFHFMGAIAFQVPSLLKTIWEDSVTPLPTALILWDTGVHICPFDSNNEAINVEALIYEFFGYWFVLWIPDVNLDNDHIRLGGNLNNLGPESNVGIIKDILYFDECFYCFRVNRHVSTF